MTSIEKYGLLIAALSVYARHLRVLIELSKEAEEAERMIYFTNERQEARKLIKVFKEKIANAHFQGNRLYAYNWKSTNINKNNKNHGKRKGRNESGKRRKSTGSIG
jgi:hypothetical protein